jgi:hypothetical protein
VAAQIVDALERVEIEEEDRIRTMTVRRCGQGTFQFLVEAAAVRQAGERVLHRKLMRAPLGLDAARDFAALQQEKVPGQRKQSEAEKRRERQRFVRLDDVLLRGPSTRRPPSPPTGERSPRSSSGSDAMCASRWLSHEIAWDYSTQKRCGRPLGKSRESPSKSGIIDV